MSNDRPTPRRHGDLMGGIANPIGLARWGWNRRKHISIATNGAAEATSNTFSLNELRHMASYAARANGANPRRVADAGVEGRIALGGIGGFC